MGKKQTNKKEENIDAAPHSKPICPGTETLTLCSLATMKVAVLSSVMFTFSPHFVGKCKNFTLFTYVHVFMNMI